jgi:hypothetical protein
MATQQSTASDEAQIRQLIEQWTQALYAKVMCQHFSGQKISLVFKACS